MSNVLILGGHGKVALLAAPLLAAAGHTVTSAIRDAAQSADVKQAGAIPLVLDIEHAGVDELTEAFRGQDAIVFSAGAGGGSPERTRAVDHDAAVASMRAAEAAGVRRYVMVSYLGASLEHGLPEDDDFFPYAQAKAEADAALQATDLDWTILGPAALTLVEPTGRITVDPDLDAPDAPRGEVSRGNVARVIAAVLEDPSTVRTRIEFVDGDTPITEAVEAA
ncbi:NAD(P)H-binding protein [Micrococcus sp. NPDC078436]|uniref:NAD(P)H-binding protein n=1 Tax=Micrococcus sp. NPDC078436 TaxID=3154960 RepID=UPI00344F8321